MDPADYYDLSLDDEPTAQEKAQALAAALDRQSKLGLLGQLSGDHVISPVGQGLQQRAQQGQQMLAQAGEKRLQRQTEADRNASLAQYHQDLVDQRSQTEDDKAAGRGLYGKGLIKYGKNALGQVVANDTSTPSSEVVDSNKAPPKLLVGGKGRGGAGGEKPGQFDKAVGLLKSDLDPSLGRNGLFGKDEGIRTAADKLLALTAHGTNLRPDQMTEFATALASMIANGGTAAQSQIEHLTPHTLTGDLAKQVQWITSRPAGTQQQEFVQSFVDTAKREKALAAERIRSVQLRRLAAHPELYSKHPAEAKALARQYLPDLAEQDLDAAFQGTYRPAPGGGGAAGHGGAPAAAAAPKLEPGEVLMVDPKGAAHAVPEGQVAAALEHKWRKG